MVETSPRELASLRAAVQSRINLARALMCGLPQTSLARFKLSRSLSEDEDLLAKLRRARVTH